MTDKELCEMFGTTLEEVDADVEKYENSNFSEMTFGAPVEGRPIGKIG